MSRKTPVDRGELRAAWESRGFPPTPDGATAETARLANAAPHAGIIEHGARPHPVSREGVESIRQWVWRNRAKFGLVTASGASGRGDRVERQVDAITWGIVRKLRRYGQKPTHFVSNEQGALTRLTKAEVEKQLAALGGRVR